MRIYSNKKESDLALQLTKEVVSYELWCNRIIVTSSIEADIINYIHQYKMSTIISKEFIKFVLEDILSNATYGTYTTKRGRKVNELISLNILKC